MALEFATKKRTRLLNIVDRLVEKTEEKSASITLKKQEDVLQPSPRPGNPMKTFLLPPTPSSGPASPSISEESVGEEEEASDKTSTVDGGSEEIKKDHRIPRQPQRCEVCGLRVYKSYRFVNRTSAPIHLKNFVAQNERVRVCKRCFSSRERCRQNLALVLLRSKTSEMVHVRTPLGVTYNRTTKGIDYIVRDLKQSLKRPYEDLLCDETMADEDEMEVENDKFLLNGPTSKDQEGMPKISLVENGNTKDETVLPTPVQRKNVGIVTVVKQQRGEFSSTPNCFTIYGDVGNLKVTDIATTGKATDQGKNGPTINATEHLKKLVEHGIPLQKEVNNTTQSEINNINNKLTFLDHAYALPPPKGKAPAALRSQPVNKVKPVVPKVIKATNTTTKQEPQKKAAPSDGQSPSAGRNCGIVCFLCNNLVTKSYSCYKKETAPEKIKHLFTSAVKVVKVCRRCMPYKKPREEEASKGKTKVIKGKLAKIKSAKLVKNAKSTAKGNGLNANEKKGTEKSIVKSPIKDEKKRKKGSVEDNTKFSPAKKQCSVVEQTKKTPPTLQLKVTKIQNTTPIQVTVKNVVVPKGTIKLEGGKATSPKAVYTNARVLSTSSKEVIVKKDSHMSEADKSKESTIEKETLVLTKQESAKVDFGTQSIKSLIGVNKVKMNSGVVDEVFIKERKSDSLNVNEEVANESISKESDVKSVSVTDENETNLIEITVATSFGEKDNTETQKADGEERPKETNVSVSCPEEAHIDDKSKETEVVSGNDSAEDKQEVENKEVSKGTMEGEGVTRVESKNLTDSINVRERRSAPQSPVRGREVKPTEVPSPRRGRSSGTPDKKQEDYKQIMPTVMTRKRLASFSDSEAEKKGEVSPGVTTGKRRAVVALLEKMSRKSGVSPSAQNASVSKETEESKNKRKAIEEEAKGHPMTRRNQMPINCPGCNEKVVKSYRCLVRGTAPQHIKPLFEQQSAEMLRVCRKCVNKK